MFGLQFIDEKIKQNLEQISSQKIVFTKELELIEYVKTGYKSDNCFPVDGWEKFNTNFNFTNTDEHFYFHIKFHSFAITENQSVYFRVKTGREDLRSETNPQGLIYINDKIVQAVDTNHYLVKLNPDTDIDLYCYYYTGMEKCNSYFKPDMVIIDNRIEALYYDVVVESVYQVLAVVDVFSIGFLYASSRGCVASCLTISCRSTH